ncbi:Anaphase-promoting complex subunit 4 [Fasciola hepatica]|uniref:Anaphase-promoting complex subunit 4 n=1 Tax=Fasciola hepatica TaxID=6192 RepID=A0A2H1C352_FASHE|nr:Anaphase-promoting complex subunit 4 [Fasciola hepatica]
MSCDISRVFHTLIRAIHATGETKSSKNLPNRPAKSSNTFSFWNRAGRLRSNLEVLAEYVRRVQQLTATSVGNSFKQRVHSELTSQVTDLIEQCTSLLIQLKEISRLDDSGLKLASSQQQLNQHRQAIYEALEGELNKLKRLRDVETGRQRHLMELTGSLASGVRSISPSRLKFNEIRSVTRKEHSPGESLGSTVRNRKPSASSVVQSELSTDRRVVEQPNLTNAEIQSLELENRLLYNHLSNQKEDLTQVARAITEIGRLNQTLSMHLTDQLEATQQISTNLTNTTEDVVYGNEQLRAALSNKASMQFWILFVLVVLTFSLHFLDWYYP